ncbi:hypothetical protein IFM89_014431 [Coptis chinensis]|uniref:Protein transport protein SEC23 n=1 Tax=Coptis chinensis TaxID=261450 RepID=A0A835I431_9MAGN|nr:hypothetical protein IFM89_014431 [Coptis chinensis]
MKVRESTSANATTDASRDLGRNMLVNRNLNIRSDTFVPGRPKLSRSSDVNVRIDPSHGSKKSRTLYSRTCEPRSCSDVFACALDRLIGCETPLREKSYLHAYIGVRAELKVAVERTGGLVVLAESFGHSVFKDSLRRVFQSSDYDLGLSFK